MNELTTGPAAPGPDTAAASSGPDRDQPSLSLPKAGGDIRGMGEKFSTNPVTGTASLSVPVAVTPGRAGATPQLALAYDSGGGNTVFGLGWSIDVPSVSRRTDKGIPRYDDTDVFQLTGAEDLVPADVPAPRVDGGFDVQAYRPRTEGSFSRIERWRDRGSGDIHWRVTSRDNVTSVFGRDPANRIADPVDPGKVFRWLLEEVTDDRGNVTSYDYKPEDGAANRHLKRVRYGNVTPYAGDAFLFEVVLDYGEHDTTPEEVRPWQLRADPFSTRRPGFELRTSRLCRRILMFHRVPELGNGPVLVASTDLDHKPDPVCTKLMSVTHKGYLGSDVGALPPLRFDYTQRVVSGDWQALAGGPGRAPVRLDSGYRWTDLDGEGIAGVLTEQNGAWYYRPNLGDGVIAEPRLVDPLPATAGLAGGGQLMDLFGDGRPALTDLAGPAPGFYRRTPDQGWAAFQPFAQLPVLSWRDDNLRFVDVTGDGLADVLVTGDDGLTWYPSAGLAGFGDASRVALARTEELGPLLVFADAEQCVYLADMTGDGLTDLVRVRNGEIAYWPSLGYGRFGAKVSMAGAPVFDHPDRFDQRRIRLSDVDGSGPADLLYVGSDGVRVWFNQAGNSWSEPETVDRAGVVGEVSVADLLGHGTSCLVVAEDRPDQEPQVRYVDLMAAGKPHLLSSVDNGMGLTTTVRYESSTTYYLADKAAGWPWATTLPFPVQVVAQTQIRDDVADTTLVTINRYRHGFYDGVEREFRGFGYVEQRDAFDDDTQDLHQPPTVSKRWQHTGFPHRFADEYWGGALLPDTPMPAGLSSEEEREAARALRGHVLRTEIYAADGSDRQDLPYSVTESNYQLRLVQPQGERPYAVVLASAGETLTVHSERQVDDPRTTHEVTLEIDDWGNVLRSAQIAYPRKSPLDDEQAATHVTVTESVVVNDVTNADRWRVGVPVRTDGFEVGGVTAAAGEVLGRATLVDGLAAASRNEIPYQATLSGTLPQRRRISSTVQTYSSDDLTAELAVGQVGARALAWRSYRQAFADGHVAALFGSRVTDDVLAEAGYLRRDGEAGWWNPSGRSTFDAQHFYLATGYVDPFGSAWQLGYDPHQLSVTSVTDPLGNTVSALLNYRVVQPWLLTDPNGNRTGVRFDSLGMVVATALLGKGDGDVLDLSTAEAAKGDDPTTRLEYDLTQRPVRFHTFAREKHGAANPRWQESWTYSDGTGRTMLTKVQAEQVGGQARWVGNGRTVYDNKGNPVKQYEPYFSGDGGFDTEPALVASGVTPILRYDPLGRLIRTDFPDGSLARVEFSAWEQRDFDRNDTVREGTWYATRAALPASDPRNRAAQLTLAHADTPQRTRFDPLGRAYVTTADNGSGQLFTTTVQRDIQGNELAVVDARGVQVMTRWFDMLDHAAHTASPDAGERWSLLDVSGKPVRVWDGNGAALRYRYDALRRSTHAYAGDRLRTRTFYGESLVGAADHNLRTRACSVYDTAGLARITDVDLKGNTVSGDRRLAADPHGEPDWSPLADVTDPDLALAAAGSLLESVAHTTHTVYDALSRPVEETYPDGSVAQPGYNEANLLETLDVRIGGATEWTRFVADVDYDAKGRRTLLKLGCGSRTSYTYEPDTFRLSTLSTVDPNGVALQSLSYTYDPVGNVTQTDDAAQQTVFFANAVVPAGRLFSYEPVYRLSSAQGREHIGQTTVSQPGPFDGPPFEIPHANDAQAMRNYTETYSYNEVGSIVRVAHAAGTGSWTRRHDNAADSNRLLASSVPADGPDAFSQPYTYDANGNATSMPHLRQLDWDVENRLTHVDLGGGGHAYYQYDSAGQRVRATVENNGTTEVRIYLGHNEIYRKVVAGTVRVERGSLHVMDGVQRVALVETTDGATVPRYQLTDHLGSSVVEVDGRCAMLSFEEYHPYGTTSFQSATGAAAVSTKRYRFTGKEKDAETGLYYHGARYYAAWLGRWVSPDPAGTADGPNPYVYVHDRPITMSDPNGKWGVEMHFAAVYWSGRLAGASHAEALLAAVASQGMDDFRELEAPSLKINGAARTFVGGKLPTPSVGTIPGSEARQLRMGNSAHALQAPNRDIADRVARQGIADHNIMEFGMGLHTAGDFLPHANLSGEATVGHQNGFNEDFTKSGGLQHDADYTFRNPQKALSTFAHFTELWADFKGSGKPELSAQDLASLGQFIYARDWNEMAKALDAGMRQSGKISDAEIKQLFEFMGNQDARRSLFIQMQQSEAGSRGEAGAFRTWGAMPNDNLVNAVGVDIGPYLSNLPTMPSDPRFEAEKANNVKRASKQDTAEFERVYHQPVSR